MELVVVKLEIYYSFVVFKFRWDDVSEVVIVEGKVL